MAEEKNLRVERDVMASRLSSGFLGEKEQIINKYVPIIRYMAYRLAYRVPPGLDVDDLVNAGIIGLMDAAEKYDPAKATRFEVYAGFRIRGAMLDEIRAMDWVPRSVREKMALIRRAYCQLERDFCRHPSEEDVARFLDMSLNDFHDLLYQTKSATCVYIEDLRYPMDQEVDLSPVADEDIASPLSSLIAKDINRLLVEAIEQLPERQRQVIILYYYDKLTMKMIGKVLGITESRVSQLHTRAILRLKGRLLREQVVG